MWRYRLSNEFWDCLFIFVILLTFVLIGLSVFMIAQEVIYNAQAMSAIDGCYNPTEWHKYTICYY